MNVYWFEQVLWLIMFSILIVAVLWETQHLIDWVIDLRTHDIAGLLRQHAYTYVRWFFGTDFGWGYE